jgi:hypothetical protein
MNRGYLEEVNTMTVVPAPEGQWVVGEHDTVASITVPLIPAVAADLQRLCGRTNLSTTDLTNRAITSYEFFDAQLRDGCDLIVRDNGTGKTRLVRFG